MAHRWAIVRLDGRRNRLTNEKNNVIQIVLPVYFQCFLRMPVTLSPLTVYIGSRDVVFDQVPFVVLKYL